ncbi:MAG: rod shape-determining protein RodA [Deltaproteobacteria bacterium]|nr:rod shape-determining protein RodA [Deltaproteobacteria bacterium]
MFDRRLLENFDWIFLLLVLALNTLGIVNLYSASLGAETGGTPVYLKQFFWMLGGLLIMTIIIFFDYHFLKKFVAYFLYGFGIFLLILVLFIGRKTAGAQRWIDLGIMAFQPSEITKVLVMIALAKYFSDREFTTTLGMKQLLGPALILGIPFLLIMKQPDLGTALHLSFSGLSLILFLGVRTYVLVGSVIAGGVAFPFGWHILKDYQKKRILTFLDPEGDPLGAGYHIIQSKIAVGSGQFWGKGFLKGTQSQLRFLPEQHTDFAFSVFSEEWGFFGSLVLLTLFFLFIFTGLMIVRRCQDRFGAFLALGLISLLFWQILINVSMVTGLMPVVGIPLPFISYGGTSLLTTFICVGLLLNISMRRFIFQDSAGVKL